MAEDPQSPESGPEPGSSTQGPLGSADEVRDSPEGGSLKEGAPVGDGVQGDARRRPEKKRIEPVRGRVQGLLKSGFEVVLEDGRAGTCSLAQMELGRVDAPSAYLHGDFDFVIVGQSDEGDALKLSRRRILEREARAKRAALLERVVPKARLRGKVTRLADFGVFVDLGGIEGMVHLTEVSHRRIGHPVEVLAVGEEVEVVVLRVDRESRGRSGRQRGGKGNSRGGKGSSRGGERRISLSIKQAQDDPWKSVSQRFSAWQVVAGKVVRVTEFGAFLEVAPGIEGLLHASEVPAGALEKIEEASRGGAMMTVLVLHVDKARQRVSLGAAPGGLQPGDRIEPVVLREGKNVTGKVESVEPGAVTLRLGPGQIGVIPDNEMATERGTDHRAEFPPGTEVEAEVVRLEGGGRRARLSRKKLLRRQERAEVARHMRSQGSGSLSTLGDLLQEARSKEDGSG